MSSKYKSSYENIIKNKNNKPPIIKKSYGIISSRFNNKNKIVEILLIQKRTTFYYIEFILKSHFLYKVQNNENALLFLFDHMSHEEKIDILSLDFGRMWYRIFMLNPDSPFTPHNMRLTPDKYEKYQICKSNFEKNYVLPDKGNKLKELICKSRNSYCLWEIPKGRKIFSQEKDLVCAVREFEEETGISGNDYRILEEFPFTTTVNSLNIKYINYLYLAIMTNDSPMLKNPKLDYLNTQQLSEVADISWMSIDKIGILDNTGKLFQLAKNINKILRKRHKIQKLTELNLLYDIPFINDEQKKR
jgi:8-oxo-dGTP pyrophosphatase MutT (NUDIX family)